ncbi:hypothetical protein HQ865_08645 [Mucilaginibacter mali]|uniref:Uncharacterized protein n=1 Tax=Mucilaginibacter mali TaxID=2740462 RepID=A0A7D4UP54_9SPHI|nr:hypothetical protein [Mucilaginibacter mali]QKJ29820.1 hypothetical protein HQ865_08645 [Mucilaginibacter mali]
MKTTLPIGIYQENDKRFEFDFAHYLLKIKTYEHDRVWGTTVSPFRVIKNEDSLYLLIHNYDRSGDRMIMIESMDSDELVISHDNTSYKLNKVA